MDGKDKHIGIIITCDSKGSEGIMIKIDTCIARSKGLITAECLQCLAMLGTMLLQTYQTNLTLFFSVQLSVCIGTTTIFDDVCFVVDENKCLKAVVKIY